MTWPCRGHWWVFSPSSTAEFGGEKDWGMGEPEGAGAAAAPGVESPADRADVILTPDQRVRVFISSTLEELAAELAAARRPGSRRHSGLLTGWPLRAARAAWLRWGC